MFPNQEPDVTYWTRLDLEERVTVLEDLLTQAQRQLIAAQKGVVDEVAVASLVREIGLVLG